MENKPRIIITLPEAVLERARTVAENKGLSLTALIRMLLIEYLEKKRELT